MHTSPDARQSSSAARVGVSPMGWMQNQARL